MQHYFQRESLLSAYEQDYHQLTPWTELLDVNGGYHNPGALEYTSSAMKSSEPDYTMILYTF